MMASAPLGDAHSRALDRLAPGEHGVIRSVDCAPVIARRLMEMGIIPGTEVSVVRRAPLGDPIEITVRGVHLSLRRSEAKHIDVSPA